MIVPRYPALVALLALLAAGCPKPRPARLPPPQLEGRSLSGVWLGTTRDRVALREFREVQVLLLMEAHGATGKLTGNLSQRGGLTTAYRGKLPCNGEARAELKRTAPLSHGRFDKKRARFNLGDRTQAGARGCGFRFPWNKTCTLRPRRDGRLALTCGPLKVALRRVELTGVWAWDQERTDRAGDLTIKRQRFHLVQRGTALAGHADDLRVNVSQDGQRYRCNGRLRYTQQTRQKITGTLTGLTVRLQLTSPFRRGGPCAGDELLPGELVGTWKPFEDRLELPLTKDGRKLRRLPGLQPVGATAKPKD